MKLSIVTTLYNSSQYIEEFYRRVSHEANKVFLNQYEIIFVNDGSPDDSLNKVIKIIKNDDKVKLIDLSKNFGHHKAILTGLMHTCGELVFLIDCDLEEEPEYLSLFLSTYRASGSDVVYGVQQSRKGHFFEKISGAVFYKLFKFLSDVNIPENLVTARLMSRLYVDSLLLHKEKEVFIAGLWQITGFVQSPYVIQKHNTSATTYSFQKKISLLINSITSFSNKPLNLIFFVGIFIFFVSLVYTCSLVFNWFFLSKPLQGWTSLIASVWLLGGIMISFLGVIGIYLSKIFLEIKNRPLSIVRQIITKKSLN